jgi:hypothetical protein
MRRSLSLVVSLALSAENRTVLECGMPFAVIVQFNSEMNRVAVFPYLALSFLISAQARRPAEFKHIIKRRKRN